LRKLIRHATPEDASLVASMTRAMVMEMESMGGHKVARDESIWAALPGRVTELLSNTDDHLYLVAVAEDPTITQGFAEANTFKLGGAFESTRMLHIGSVYVYPEHRGKGVGGRLIVDVLDWGRRAGCTSCELNVLSDNPAKRLYEKNGFVEFQSQMTCDLS